MTSCVSTVRLEEELGKQDIEVEHLYRTMADTTFACELTLRSVTASFIRDNQGRSNFREDLRAEIGSHVVPKHLAKLFSAPIFSVASVVCTVFTSACVRAAAPQAM